jgi:hypothetical protein
MTPDLLAEYTFKVGGAVVILMFVVWWILANFGYFDDK